MESSSSSFAELQEKIRRLQSQLYEKDDALFEVQATLVAVQTETQHQIRQLEAKYGREKMESQNELRMLRLESQHAQLSNNQRHQHQQNSAAISERTLSRHPVNKRNPIPTAAQDDNGHYFGDMLPPMASISIAGAKKTMAPASPFVPAVHIAASSQQGLSRTNMLACYLLQIHHNSLSPPGQKAASHSSTKSDEAVLSLLRQAQHSSNITYMDLVWKLMEISCSDSSSCRSVADNDGDGFTWLRHAFRWSPSVRRAVRSMSVPTTQPMISAALRNDTNQNKAHMDDEIRMARIQLGRTKLSSKQQKQQQQRLKEIRRQMLEPTYFMSSSSSSSSHRARYHYGHYRQPLPLGDGRDTDTDNASSNQKQELVQSWMKQVLTVTHDWQTLIELFVDCGDFNDDDDLQQEDSEIIIWYWWETTEAWKSLWHFWETYVVRELGQELMSNSAVEYGRSRAEPGIEIAAKAMFTTSEKETPELPVNDVEEEKEKARRIAILSSFAESLRLLTICMQQSRKMRRDFYLRQLDDKHTFGRTIMAIVLDFLAKLPTDRDELLQHYFSALLVVFAWTTQVASSWAGLELLRALMVTDKGVRDYMPSGIAVLIHTLSHVVSTEMDLEHTTNDEAYISRQKLRALRNYLIRIFHRILWTLQGERARSIAKQRDCCVTLWSLLSEASQHFLASCHQILALELAARGDDDDEGDKLVETMISQLLDEINCDKDEEEQYINSSTTDKDDAMDVSLSDS